MLKTSDLPRTNYFIEYLNARGFFSILPILWRRPKPRRVFVIDAAPLVFYLTRAVSRILGVNFESFNFKLVDVKDADGLLIRLKVEYMELIKIQEKIYRRIVQGNGFLEEERFSHFRTYLKKSLVCYNWMDPSTLSRSLTLIHLVTWYKNHSNDKGDSFALFLARQSWMSELSKYGAVQGVSVQTWWPHRRKKIKEILKYHSFFRYLYLWMLWFLHFLRFIRLPEKQEPERMPPRNIGIDFYGQCNFERPEFYSDFFPLQQSDLPPQECIAVFQRSSTPLDPNILESLRRQGMVASVLDPRAVKVRGCRVVYPQLFKKRAVFLAPSYFNLNGFEKRWFKERIKNFNRVYTDWKRFLDKNGINIFFSWDRYNELHCIIGKAIRERGGLLALYQRALDPSPAATIAVHSDVVFGYSRFCGEIERESGSKIDCYVVTGYFGDHRFPLLKPMATEVRNGLLKNGARRVLAFTDENSGDDARWHTGHEFMRDNYLFLLEKLLSHPWLGLVLKPKVPFSLRKRLGSVSALLDQAIATGRCFLFEGGSFYSPVPPAVASLSADIAIHGHVCASTAGLESALTGTPTLLVDREGWGVSPLYRLGLNSVIFKDWQTLWECCLEHWNTKQDTGLGNWSALIKELDPFRDGLGAYRVGFFLKELQHGFTKGFCREKSMAEATQRYCDRWGEDKIFSIH